MRPATGLRLYLATSFPARLAEEGMAVAVVLLAVERTGDAAQGAFTLTAWMAPHVLAAPLTGGLAARVRRPRLFYLCALGGFALAIAAVGLLMGRAPAGVTLAVALAGGTCGPIVSGGLSSLVPVLAPGAKDRDRAYALDAAGYNAASVAGPAVVSVAAGLLTPGAATGLLAGAAGCAALLSTALPLRHTPVQDGARQPLRADLLAGLAAVWRVRELRAITAATCLGHLGVGALTSTAVLLAADRGHLGGGGVLMTAFAVGALVGALAVARLPPLPAQRMAGLSLLGTGAALGAAALVPWFGAGVALFAVAGLADGPLLAATLQIRAGHAPEGARTQVFTLGAGLKITAAASGAALAGAGAGLDPALLLLAVAAVQLAAAALYAAARAERRTVRAAPGPAVPAPPDPARKAS
ncbi:MULTISPECIES: MFS transporter [Thermomonosporaceae]|uniref:MFS transporter n=1 Tax=Thermomonosporaceae TaxID=2012 RepID=UPI00255ABDA2|nr:MULTISPECIES: MFS transporter [Thermomonosporaceae]MDL4776371.1 MFS transporter [Actinomadura xylanilytica]